MNDYGFSNTRPLVGLGAAFALTLCWRWAGLPCVGSALRSPGRLVARLHLGV